MSDSAKAKIIEVANKLFAEKGYEATSIREIASRAEVNLASINYYFGSKQGLFEYMVEEFVSQKFSLVVSVLDPPEAFEEFKLRLTLFVRQFISLAQNEKDAFCMMNKNIETFARTSPELFAQSFKSIRTQFIEFVQMAQEKEILRPDFDLEVITQIIFGSLIDMVKGNELRKHFGGLDIEDPEANEKYIDTLIKVVVKGMGV